MLDEGLHLMSACQLVGFQHFIGSLWEVSDPYCLVVARTVFTKMVDSGMNDDSVSLGLQEGVTYLRDRGRSGLRIKRDGNGDGDDNPSGNDSDERDGSSISNDEELANVDRAGHGHMEKFSMLIIGLGLEVTPEYGLPISISDGRCPSENIV